MHRPLRAFVVRSALRITYLFLAAACAFAVAGGLAAPANAEVAPSLAGENLLAGVDEGAGTFDTVANCNPDGTGTISFFAQGLAAGPYPGTFTESGTVTISPGGTGTVTAFDATFTIVSGATIINGTKTFASQISASDSGGCVDREGIYLAEADSGASYEATINAPTGTFEDSGGARALLNDVRIAGAPPTNTNFFNEEFLFSNGVVPVQSEAHVTGGGWIVGPTGEDISFGFTAQNDGSGPKGNCTVIDHAARVDIKCLTVETTFQTATHADFTGQAEVNGVVESYRIDVDDLGEPGTGDTFKIQTDSYTAAGPLAGGNIQIHPASS